MALGTLNTFYIVNGLNIEFIKTVKDKQYLIDVMGIDGLIVEGNGRDLNQVIADGDIVIPEGYTLPAGTYTFIEMTDFEKCENGIITLEEFKSRKKEKIKDNFDIFDEFGNINNPLISNTFGEEEYNSDRAVKKLFGMMIAVFICGEAPPLEWKTKNGTFPLDETKLKAVYLEIYARYVTVFQDKEMKYALIDAATTAQEVEDIIVYEW